jgi:nucleotide-binding universal stress UspA family protein
MMRSILVPVDGSPFGEQALAPAARLAAQAEAGLEVVLVHEPVVVAPVVPIGIPATPPLSGLGIPDPVADREVRARHEAYVHAVAKRLGEETSLAVRATVLDGPVVEALAAHAAEVHADLIVMCTHGRGGLTRSWLGSVADGVVREVTVPVLLLKPDHTEPPPAVAPFRRVLVPLDGSALAEEVLSPVTKVLVRDADAAITLFVAIAPMAVVASASLAGPDSPGSEESTRLEQQTHAYLEGVASRLRAQGFSVRTHTASHQHAAHAILAYAAELQADLIALSTHGRGGLRRLLLGSVADKVLRGAASSVLLYRRDTA